MSARPLVPAHQAVRVIVMVPGATILIVENSETLQRALQQTLGTRYKVLTASGWKQALEIRARSNVDAVVADVSVTPDHSNGLEDLWVQAGSVPFILVAGTHAPHEADRGLERHPSLVAVSTAEPVQLRDLTRTLEDAFDGRRISRDPGRGHPATDESTGILAESRAMRGVMALIRRAAMCDTPVLLVGESGTGKELLARALHKESPHARGPFVAVNCSAIPEALLESELFGHRRGSFTDARDDQPGLFQTAQRGTILLDEIGDMAPALQGKLLRVLQEKEVHPVGASAPVPIDVRIITATHRDLTALVDEGRFRQDLLYRINVIEVQVPPLRERPDDLAPLVRYLIDKHGARLGKRGCTVSSEAMVELRRHAWPGNVRELENVIERALVLGSGTVIRIEDLPDTLRNRPSRPVGVSGRRLADVEREHIVRTLRTVAGNKAAAARVLGLNRKTLYRKLTQHRITPAATVAK